MAQLCTATSTSNRNRNRVSISSTTTTSTITTSTTTGTGRSSPSLLSACLLLLAISTASLASPPPSPPPPTITVPHLSGIFVALDAVTANRTSWRADLQAMKDVGIEFLVVRAAAQGVSWNASADPSAGCPLGRFDAYFPPVAGSPLARCLRQQLGNADALRTVLEDAAALGLGVHLGLSYPEGAANAAARGANATQYYRDYAWLQWSIARDLWSRYGDEFGGGGGGGGVGVGGGGGSGTIRGFYTDLEECNEVGYLALASPLAGHLLQPLSHDIHEQLSADLLVWASPYFVANLTRHSSRDIMNARFYADFWGQMFTWAPDFGLIAPQDSMGAQGNSFENVSTYVDAMRAASQHAAPAPRPFWSNVELFEVWPRDCEWPSVCHGRHPAPFARIKAQLANEAPRADKLIGEKGDREGEGGGSVKCLYLWLWL